MRRLIMLLSLAMLTAITTFAKTPIGDWQAVQLDIPRGWQITVVTAFTFPCIFEKASAEELICEPPQCKRTACDSDEIHVARERIREIRVERREGANMLAGAAGGGGLGAVLGALLVAGGRGPSAYIFGLGGASLGAHRGRDVHILRGKVIYRRDAGDHELPSTQKNVEATARRSP